MSIREIKYNVTSLGVTPASHQWGGVQHEDNATTVSYFIGAEYLAELGDVTKLRFRIDFNSPSAGYDPSPNLELNNSVLSRDIPQKMTKYGGNMQATLVISRINTDNLPETLEEILQIPSTVFFTSATRQDERFNKNLSAYEEYVGELITEVAENVKETEVNAEQALEHAEFARTQSESAAKSNSDAGSAAMYAEQLAKEAEGHKNAAENYAYDALRSANTASIALEGAEQAKIDAENFASEAEKAKNNAKTSEENAKASAEEAKKSVEALLSANNIFSNALKGTASGEVIGINDVSPIEHEMGVKVSGKNLPDISAVKVKKYGKNLVDISQMLNNALVDNGDGTFSYTRASDNYFSTNFPLKLKAGTTITLNMEQVSTTDDTDKLTCSFTYADGSTTSCYIGIGTGMEFTAEKNTVNVRIFSYNTGTEFVFKNLQFEIGSTATEYEPYIQPTEYTPDADGTVQGVTSLYPSTTLMTDTDGVIIEAIYNKDINKAFEELKNAILATGGNV